MPQRIAQAIRSPRALRASGFNREQRRYTSRPPLLQEPRGQAPLHHGERLRALSVEAGDSHSVTRAFTIHFLGSRRSCVGNRTGAYLRTTIFFVCEYTFNESRQK